MNPKPLTHLSVVIPIYNEADNVIPLTREIEQALNGQLEHEIIYVDDGSSDDTVAVLKSIKNQHNNLRIIQHNGNYGQSTALYSGVKASQHAWVVSLDGDRQNDPMDIPQLLVALAENPAAKMVAGNRCKRKDTWLKRISSRIANRTKSWMLQDSVPDAGCGLKLIHRQTFLELPFFDHMHRFLSVLVQRHGGEVISVPVNHRPRIEGYSKYGIHNRLWVGIIDLFGVIWLQRRAKSPIATEEHS